jgi:transcription antitermination factor NusG
MQRTNVSYPWYAIRVRSRFENVVATILEGKGYEGFLPLYDTRRTWSDRIKQIQVPLFPGYVFCRFDVQRRLPILTTPGVVGIVGVGKCPVALDDAEIMGLQVAVRSGLPTGPWPFLRIGQQVRIEYGPLSGLKGILLNFKGQQRLVLSVTLLQRAIAVEVDGAWVQPISDYGPGPLPQ